MAFESPVFYELGCFYPLSTTLPSFVMELAYISDAFGDYTCWE